jgi:Flp pilus assembly protein TadG
MRYYHACAQAARRRRGSRRGTIIVLSAVLMVVLMGLLALSIDTGYMYTMQTELDRSVDAAALAGAAMLVQGLDDANDSVVEYLVRNPVGNTEGAIAELDINARVAKFLVDHDEDLQIQWGNWNPQAGQLELTNELPSAIEVSMRYPNLPLFFGRVLGKDSFAVEARAIAMYQPRDIMLVLDYSGSMNDDSELKSIGVLGYDSVLANLEQIYEELGFPEYGNLQFEPQYITVAGRQPQYPTQPQLVVQYQGRAAQLSTTQTLSKVVLVYDDGSSQSFFPGGVEALVQGSGKKVSKVRIRSGKNPDNSDYWETFDFSPGVFNSKVKTAMGLNGVSYPYPSGSWDSYIDYVESSSTIRNAGFEFKFGFANLINYWLEQKPGYSQTPDLWKVSAQPVTAVKDSVDVFMDFIQRVDTNDRVGLVVYNGAGGEATLELPLTREMDQVAVVAGQRQAGHYHVYTNIGAGMRVARQQLELNGRAEAFKMIVLMTDGQANWYQGSYSTSAARSDVQGEASLDADLKFPVVTISLGSGADTALMDEVAETTASRHFNVPGGRPVSEYREDLIQVFREIADNRPLKLVQ